MPQTENAVGGPLVQRRGNCPLLTRLVEPETAGKGRTSNTVVLTPVFLPAGGSTERAIAIGPVHLRAGVFLL